VHKKLKKPLKKHAPEMIKYRSSRQLSLSEFILPFNGSLDKNNCWVRLANILSWDELVAVYPRGLSIASETEICMVFFAMSVAAYFAAYFSYFIAQVKISRCLIKLYKAISGLMRSLMINLYLSCYIIDNPV